MLGDGLAPRPGSRQSSLAQDELTLPSSHWCSGLVGFYGFDADSQSESVPAALNYYTEPAPTPPSNRVTCPPQLRSAAIVCDHPQQQRQHAAQLPCQDDEPLCEPTIAASPSMTGTSTLVNETTASPDSCVSHSSHTRRRTSSIFTDSCDGRSDHAAATPRGDQGATHKVLSATHGCISVTSFEFLQANLARWCKHGLWCDSSPLTATAVLSGYEKLQRAYSFVCRLDTRMSDDAIRSRMAMVTLHLEYEATCKRGTSSRASTSVGRGHTSSTIDSILESVHSTWDACGPREKAALRTKFHEWKRFGKRWWLLASIVGPSIMLLASARFAGMVKNTTVTTAMLRFAGHTIKTSQPHVMSALRLTNAITKSLLCNNGYENYDVELLLEQLREFSVHFRESGIV